MQVSYRSISCAWTITPVNPNNRVEVEVLEYQPSSIYSSCYADRLNIYDGSTDSAYLLAKLCGMPASRVFQGTEDAMKIVYITSNYVSMKGFKMTYKESEGPMIFHRRLEVNLREAFLVSPRFPDGNVRNMDSTWTFSNGLGYTTEQIMLTFTDVYIGDADDCSNNYIKVFNGNASSPQSSTLCGKETGVYLSRGTASLLTVVMKTDNIPTPRGFKAKYFWLFDFDIPGCNGTAKKMVAFSISSTMDEITTPNYPNPYPNFAECSYVLEPVLSDFFLRVNIVDVEFAGPIDCTKDYIEIFDGDTTTATSLGRICRNTSKTFESTRPGTNMLIRFISDSNLGAKGAKMTFMAFSKESSGVPIWIPIFVSFLVGGILIGVIVVFYCKYVRKSGSGAI